MHLRKVAPCIKIRRMVDPQDELPHVAGKIAHDLNNVLIVLMGTADLFDLELPDDSPLRTELRSLHTAIDRARTLTNTLSAAARGVRANPTPTTPRTPLLLVEPSPRTRHLAKQCLERLGYTVLEAATNEEGDAIRAAHPHPVHRLPDGIATLATESFAFERLAEAVRQSFNSASTNSQSANGQSASGATA